MKRNKREWQQKFLKVPESVTRKLETIVENNVVVAAVKRIPWVHLVAGKYKHIGIGVVGGELSVPNAILPNKLNGLASRRNVEGKIVVRRDLPKITKVFTMEVPSWGSLTNTHTVYMSRQVYSRDFYPESEFEIEMEVVAEEENEERDVLIKFSIGTVLDKTDEDFWDDLLFCLCLLQENAGVADVFESTASKEAFLKTIYVHWEILPVGQRDVVIAKILSGYRGNVSELKKKIEERYNLLNSLKPTAFIQGSNGFRRYFGAQFGDKLVAFENLEYGNALYVMFEDWKKLSKMSRLQLIRGKKDGFTRIVHHKHWEDELRKMIKGRRPPQAA